jgi:DNA-binding MarR family transcriptional regulator
LIMNKNQEIGSFSQEIMQLLPILMRGFSRRDHEYLALGKITRQQFLGLEYLLRHGLMPMKELTRYMGTSKPAATAMVRRLITQRLVARNKHSRDHRIVLIALTPQGKRITEAIDRRRKNTLSRVFGKIKRHDRKEYLRILKEIARVLET